MIVLLLKSCLINFVQNIDISIDQIWLQLRNVDEVLFEFCYIPQCDSQYYSYDAFEAIYEKIKSNHMMNG